VIKRYLLNILWEFVESTCIQSGANYYMGFHGFIILNGFCAIYERSMETSMNKHLFISGMAKCGTTALAAWFVKQGLAEFLVPDVKEAYFYSSVDFGKSPPVRGGGCLVVGCLC
jgi:hypothetical protein